MRAVNHSFINLVNPTGFSLAQRFNVYGENPNRGFIAVPPEIEISISGNNKGPSKEGDILIKHLIRLLYLAMDGLVTQHEDWRMHDAFLFINERMEMPSPFALALRDALAKHFNIAADDNPFFGEDSKVKDGIWHNDLDGSFESLMYFLRRPSYCDDRNAGAAGCMETDTG